MRGRNRKLATTTAVGVLAGAAARYGMHSFEMRGPATVPAHVATGRTATRPTSGSRTTTVPEVRNVLFEPEPATQPASRDTRVAYVQQLLARVVRGYVVTSPGQLDQRTRDAIKAAEASYHMPITGNITDRLVIMLEQTAGVRGLAGTTAVRGEV